MKRSLSGTVALNGTWSCELPPIRSTPELRLRNRFTKPGRAAGPIYLSISVHSMLTPTKCSGTSPPFASSGSTRTEVAASGTLFSASSEDAPAATTGTAAVTDATIANAAAERLARGNMSRTPQSRCERTSGSGRERPRASGIRPILDRPHYRYGTSDSSLSRATISTASPRSTVEPGQSRGASSERSTSRKARAATARRGATACRRERQRRPRSRFTSRRVVTYAKRPVDGRCCSWRSRLRGRSSPRSDASVRCAEGACGVDAASISGRGRASAGRRTVLSASPSFLPGPRFALLDREVNLGCQEEDDVRKIESRGKGAREAPGEEHPQGAASTRARRRH